LTAVSAALEFARTSPEITRTRELTWQDPVPTLERAAGLPGCDYMRAVAAGELPPPPIAVLLRMAPIEVDDGRVVFAGEPGEEHYNPIGSVHGGYAATIIDSAIGCAVHTTLPVGAAYSTQTLETKYVRPITRDTGIVHCEATVLHRGRRQATAEAKVTDAASGKLLAHGTGTCLILG
jgi:uncharacterized protein (TIGR00369 family)